MNLQHFALALVVDEAHSTGTLDATSSIMARESLVALLVCVFVSPFSPSFDDSSATGSSGRLRRSAVWR